MKKVSLGMLEPHEGGLAVPEEELVRQDNCVMSHTATPKGHSVMLRKWEFWEMVGGNAFRPCN